VVKKLTFEEALKRFEHRDDITLCEDGWNGWKKKSKFYDKVWGEYFFSIPKSVFDQKSVHPDRAVVNRKKTNLKRYGHEVSVHGKDIKEKSQKTCVEKYGQKAYFGSQDARQKTKTTVKKRYNVENVSQIEAVKERKKKTTFENFGVEYPSRSDEIKMKISKTNLIKYGHEVVLHCPQIKEQIKKTNLKKFGTEYYVSSKEWLQQKSNRFIEETGEHLKVWLERQPEPKPPYVTLAGLFGNNAISEKSLLSQLKNYKTNKTTLEVLVEDLLGIKHFNKKVIDGSHPDFKLSDKIFLNADGLFWHSERNRSDPYSHFNLRKSFEDNGLRLFQLYGSEIRRKSDIVKSIVLKELEHLDITIFDAENCSTRLVSNSVAQVFFQENHLFGSLPASDLECFGLYFNDELLYVLAAQHVGTKVIIERRCEVKSAIVQDGFNSLLAEILSFYSKISKLEVNVDLRWESDGCLKENGFASIEEKLNWAWTDCRNVFDCHNVPKKNWIKIFGAGIRTLQKTI
jgi:hypothetical protein